MESYVSNGYDAVKATRAAYNCSTDESARVLSYRVLGAIAVSMVLAIHFGDQPEEAFQKLLWSRLCRGRVTSQEADLFKLYAEVMGFRRAWAGAYPELKHRAIHAQKEKHRFAKAREQRAQKEQEQAAEKQEPAGDLLEGF